MASLPSRQAEEYEELMADETLSYEDRAALRRARRTLLKKREADLSAASPALTRSKKVSGGERSRNEKDETRKAPKAWVVAPASPFRFG